MSAEFGYERVTNPIDLVEQIAGLHNWACDRTNDDELTLVVAGSWTDYHVSLNWREDLEALHVACAFDFRVPDNRLTEMYRLIAQINEQLWLGHFDLWTQEGLVMFRHALLLNASVATPRQCEAMLKAALEAWGTDANLFARGLAEFVTDPRLTKEPLAKPGQVIKRARGTAAQHLDDFLKNSKINTKKERAV